MKTVELFSGTKSFSEIMSKHGHNIFTVDNDEDLNPDLLVDIGNMSYEELPFKPDILWASPPCQGFSVASIGSNWTGGPRGYIPKSANARTSIYLASKTLLLISEIRPKWWFIENPRGLLRKMPFMEALTREQLTPSVPNSKVYRHTISYCQYGDDRMKPTDIWTNAWWWRSRPMCKNGDKCHESAPRGSRTGTQGIKGAKERGRIPPALFEEILSQMPHA